MEGRIHPMFLMILGVTCANGSLKLTTSPLPAVEGKTFSLFSHNKINATVVRWYRNGVLVLHMNYPSCSMTEGQQSGLNGNIVGSQYTSRRVNVSCADYVSSVTLLVDSSQVGSVWWLEDNNNTRSNSVTIEIARKTTSLISITSTKLTSSPPQETKSAATGQVYTVAGTSAGISIIIIATVVLICCFVKHRHTGEKSEANDDGASTSALPRSSRNVEPSVNATSETAETASYITLDHVNTTDITYTQLKSGGHSDIREGSVYYNTVPTGGGHSDISQGSVHYNTVPTGGGGHSDISERSVYYSTVPTGGGDSDISQGSVHYNTVPTGGGGHSDISQGIVYYNTVPTGGGGHSHISEGSVYYNTAPMGGGHSDISQGIVHQNTVPTAGGGHSDISEGSVYYNTVPADADRENPAQTIH